MINSKKGATNFLFGTLIVSLIMVLVVSLGIMPFIDKEAGAQGLIVNGLDSFHMKECEINPNFCKVKLCNENIECTQKEQDKSDQYLALISFCDDKSKSVEEKEKKGCDSTLYRLIKEEHHSTAFENPQIGIEKVGKETGGDAIYELNLNQLSDQLNEHNLKISSCFYRNSQPSKLHGATDFILSKNGDKEQPIPSLTKGKVHSTGYQYTQSAGFGNYVIIESQGLFYRYAHLASISVKKGEEVEFGQEIGIQGGTGRAGGYPLHVDFSISNQGETFKTDINNEDSAQFVFNKFVELGIQFQNIEIEQPCYLSDKSQLAPQLAQAHSEIMLS